MRASADPAILSLMAKYLSSLDDVFGALADPTRRAVVGVLGRGPASVGELAQSASMTLPSFMDCDTSSTCALASPRSRSSFDRNTAPSAAAMRPCSRQHATSDDIAEYALSRYRA